jgi:hypothetical protein
MPTLSDAQIAGVARQAGFTGDSLLIAVEIAIAESSGRTDVVNYLGCVGLWQIMKRYQPETTEQLKDPLTNARVAFRMSKQGTNWKPWTTYTSGRASTFHARASKAAAHADPSWASKVPGVPELSEATGKLDDISKLYALFSDRAIWVRIGMVLVGAIITVWAVIRMSATDQNVELLSTIGQLLPQTRGVATALKAVK